MLKKFFIGSSILLVLTIIGILNWQSGSHVENTPKTSGLQMKVARYYWPGSYWVEIAKNKGWFKEAGLNVELVDTNPDYFRSLQDTVDGKIDVADFTLFDLMSFNAAGANLVMVINNDNSTGAEAIVAKSTITTIAELKGKTIGVDSGNYLEYILDFVLMRHGLTPSDVTKVKIASEQAAEEIKKSKLDAIVAWEPIVSDAVTKGHGRKLFDTSEIPSISPSGHTFRRSFIEERPRDIQAYVNVWHKTTLFIQNNPKEAFAIIAGIYNVSANEAMMFTRLNQIRDLRANITSFSYGAGFESLHGAARYINNFLINKEIIKNRLDSTKFIDPTFIRSLTHTLQQEAL